MNCNAISEDTLNSNAYKAAEEELKKGSFGYALIWNFFNQKETLLLYLLCLAAFIMLVPRSSANNKNNDQPGAFFIAGYCVLLFKVVFYAYVCVLMSFLIHAKDRNPNGKYYNLFHLYGKCALYFELITLSYLATYLIFRNSPKYPLLKSIFRLILVASAMFMCFKFSDPGMIHDFKDNVIIMLEFLTCLFVLYALPLIVYFLGKLAIYIFRSKKHEGSENVSETTTGSELLLNLDEEDKKYA